MFFSVDNTKINIVITSYASAELQAIPPHPEKLRHLNNILATNTPPPSFTHELSPDNLKITILGNLSDALNMLLDLNIINQKTESDLLYLMIIECIDQGCDMLPPARAINLLEKLITISKSLQESPTPKP